MVLVRLYGFLLNLSIQSLQHKLASNKFSSLHWHKKEGQERKLVLCFWTRAVLGVDLSSSLSNFVFYFLRLSLTLFIISLIV